jgi:hypothetical protein
MKPNLIHQPISFKNDSGTSPGFALYLGTTPLQLVWEIFLVLVKDSSTLLDFKEHVLIPRVSGFGHRIPHDFQEQGYGFRVRV